MANKTEISTVLKRKLRSGKEYEKLIPTVRCERTDLGSGDTFYTVDAMKDWVEKHSFQTAKLAPKLVGQSIKETVESIYNFLYNHIQYQADGSLQQLRSPACTWRQRNQGVDCKSFSVFASSILSNLGIKHFIRQIRQPYFFPEQFTHVYVVVPQNQNDVNNSATFVLDATKHQNVESDFIEKVDLKMTQLKHIGLNAPQDERTKNIVENFNRFCRQLIEAGVDPATVNGMRARVSEFTNRGIDPRFRRDGDTIVIEGKAFLIEFPGQGLGFVDPVSVSGYAAAGNALLEMLPKDFMNNTFGAIFANGFDLSCWNASYSESKAQQALTDDIPFFLEWSGLAKNPSTATLNKFSNAMHAYIANAVNGQRSKYAKCTREGYAARQKGSEEALQKVLDTLRDAGIKVTEVGMKKGYIKIANVPSFNGQVFEWGYANDHSAYQTMEYRLEGGHSTPNLTPTTPTTGGNTGSGNSGNDYTNNYQNTGNTGNLNQEQTEGSNTGLIVSGIALASLPLLFFLKKGSTPGKSNTQKPAKK